MLEEWHLWYVVYFYHIPFLIFSNELYTVTKLCCVSTNGRLVCCLHLFHLLRHLQLHWQLLLQVLCIMWLPPQKVDILDTSAEILFYGSFAVWFMSFWFLSDPTYVVAPVLQSRSGREDLKKLFAGSFNYPPTSFSLHWYSLFSYFEILFYVIIFSSSSSYYFFLLRTNLLFSNFLLLQYLSFFCWQVNLAQ